MEKILIYYAFTFLVHTKHNIIEFKKALKLILKLKQVKSGHVILYTNESCQNT